MCASFFPNPEILSSFAHSLKEQPNHFSIVVLVNRHDKVGFFFKSQQPESSGLPVLNIFSL